MKTVTWIVPDWPVPLNVKAISTTRQGGVSQPPFDALNLGDHVGDYKTHVIRNRQIIMQQCQLPSEPLWMSQVHGNVVDRTTYFCQADARYTNQKGMVCAIMTADCLPVLLCDSRGHEIAAVHAGWRELASGVIEQAVANFNASADQMYAWLGPAIGSKHFEVGHDVVTQFDQHHEKIGNAFQQTSNHKWCMDMVAIAQAKLSDCGVKRIYGGHWCTWQNEQQFFSYRRDSVTGRMATLIWLDNQ